MPLTKVTLDSDGYFRVTGGHRCGADLFVRPNQRPHRTPSYVSDHLKPIYPLLAAAKTVEEAQAIVDGTESLVSTQRKFTAVAPEPGRQSIRILGGHKDSPGGYLYLGYHNAVSAKRCVVPELAGVIDALNAAPTVAVAQAIIDAHINAEAKVSVTVKVTEEFTVTKDEDGDIEVDGGTWYHAVGYSNIDSSEPFAALFTKLDEAAPTTVAEAVAIIKEFNRANS